MVSASALRPLKLLATPVKAFTRTFPWINAASWDLQYQLGLWNYLDSEKAGSELLRIVQKYAGQASILDLGCGTSAYLPLIPGTYRHYHGVDISRKAIKRARSLGRAHTSYETADILHYKPRQSYDVILLSEVLYYLPTTKVAGFLRRLSAFLTPGGVMMIQVWAGADSPGLAAAIGNSGLVRATETMTALDASNPRTVYILRAGMHPGAAGAV
jgi:2-polyprenyl-3-methyl-5-hydroxy-6-metoxy-1,4-benzoquinol methylase